MSGTVRFLLDGRVHEIQNPDPTATLLNYLRYEIARTGTKEGCAEGDCGACTVVVGELRGDKVDYKVVNACIIFLPTLDGKELLTVESLKSQSGGLHPVQEALVETHGSQCGFCTPGFVMSLYALYLEGQMPERGRIEDVLAGNLCRCTGYGPIIDAATRMFEIGADELPDMATQVAALKSIERDSTLYLSSKSKLTGVEKRYFAPKDIDTLAAIGQENPEATFLAGGTDVGLWVTKMHKELATVIYLGDVVELREIVETDTTIEIGAGVTYSDAITVIGRHYADFGCLIRRIGSTQIRNSGTIGGNVANGSPIGDTPPALIALGAKVILRNGDAERTLDIEDFYIDYGKQDRAAGEFVARISVPKPKADMKFRAYKLSKRFDQDISAVCAAFSITLKNGVTESATLAFGGMAAIPKRAFEAEKVLVGKPLTEEVVEAAMLAMTNDFAPLTDMRASKDYRMMASQNLLMKFYIELNEDEPTRVLTRQEFAHA